MVCYLFERRPLRLDTCRVPSVAIRLAWRMAGEGPRLSPVPQSMGILATRDFLQAQLTPQAARWLRISLDRGWDRWRRRDPYLFHVARRWAPL